MTDDGPGIATEDRERVFDMFSQNGGGGRAGLGLAIAKAFVEAHGGPSGSTPRSRAVRASSSPSRATPLVTAPA